MGKKVSDIVVNRGGDCRKSLIDHMRAASGKYSLWNVFDDFCAMAAIAIANNADPYHVITSKETRDNREKRYLETINKYDPKERALFPKMLIDLTNELNREAESGILTDVLGEIFHELEFHNKWKGQFFTPQHICNMMGTVTMAPETFRKKIDAYGYISINEPSCGSGATLLGFANAAIAEGFNYCKDVLFVANDIDERCVFMTYVQCSLYGMPIVVVQQNTLSLQVYGSPWYSPVYIFDGWHYRRERKYALECANEELISALAE